MTAQNVPCRGVVQRAFEEHLAPAFLHRQHPMNDGAVGGEPALRAVFAEGEPIKLAGAAPFRAPEGAAAAKGPEIVVQIHPAFAVFFVDFGERPIEGQAQEREAPLVSGLPL